MNEIIYKFQEKIDSFCFLGTAGLYMHNDLNVLRSSQLATKRNIDSER